MAATEINGKRVYGRRYGYGTFGPANLSIEEYRANKDRLEDAEYPVEWLRAKFGKDIKPFKFSELKDMEFLDLVAFARTLNMKYSVNSTITHTVAKNALLKALMILLS